MLPGSQVDMAAKMISTCTNHMVKGSCKCAAEVYMMAQKWFHLSRAFKVTDRELRGPLSE